jgi:hypothetical protein
MRKLIVFIISFILFGCNKTFLIDEKQQLADQVRKKAAMQIKKEKNLNPCGTAGQMMNQIKFLGLSFSYYKKLDVEEGREMVVYAAQTLAEKINAEPRIHPYLFEDPFPPQRTEIYIFLYNPDGSLLPPGELSIILYSYGVVKYKTEDPQTARLKTIYQETYEEALEKLNQFKTESLSPVIAANPC